MLIYLLKYQRVPQVDLISAFFFLTKPVFTEHLCFQFGFFKLEYKLKYIFKGL